MNLNLLPCLRLVQSFRCHPVTGPQGCLSKQWGTDTFCVTWLYITSNPNPRNCKGGRNLLQVSGHWGRKKREQNRLTYPHAPATAPWMSELEPRLMEIQTPKPGHHVLTLKSRRTQLFSKSVATKDFDMKIKEHSSYSAECTLERESAEEMNRDQLWVYNRNK